jgi:2-methylisocitrate lyase-like PEP mutase family enzyme
LGYADNDTMPPEQAFAAVARIAGAVDLPVTADVEAGYQLSPPSQWPPAASA